MLLRRNGIVSKKILYGALIPIMTIDETEYGKCINCGTYDQDASALTKRAFTPFDGNIDTSVYVGGTPCWVGYYFKKTPVMVNCFMQGQGNTGVVPYTMAVEYSLDNGNTWIQQGNSINIQNVKTEQTFNLTNCTKVFAKYWRVRCLSYISGSRRSWACHTLQFYNIK